MEEEGEGGDGHSHGHWPRCNFLLKKVLLSESTLRLLQLKLV